MGVSGISIWQLAIVLAIVVMLFGTKCPRNMVGDWVDQSKALKIR
jgi:sec-independent protein translocase protein TatA